MRVMADRLLSKISQACFKAIGRTTRSGVSEYELSDQTCLHLYGKETFSAFTNLSRLPRFTPGRVLLGKWDLDYVDAASLQNCFDVLVLKGWNDFCTDKKHPVILDCGANIGISVLRYKMLFPGAQITAFEPDPGIADVLRRNLDRNGAHDVQLIEGAVWIRHGEMSFFCEGADGSRLVSKGSRYRSNIKVKTVDFNDYISREIDLIKMDIEGAEFDVIPHIADRLRLVRNMIVECHLRDSEPDRVASLLGALALARFHVAINSYGAWRDLIRKPPKQPNEFDQYLLIAAWRET